MSVRVFAPAKINLTLKVGRPREDGMHPLASVVTFADVGDWVEARQAIGFTLTATGPFAAQLGRDPDNLVVRAARALAKAAGVDPRVELALEKNLPIASGIGGGSSDAAAALKALNALLSLGFDEAALSRIGATIGADVPVCVGARSAFVTGIGETIAPFALPTLHAVLVNPMWPLATADVFREFDRAGADSDVSMTPPSWRSPQDVWSGVRAIGNDLAAPARALMPDLDHVFAGLERDPRTRVAALSGSGATVFALTEDEASAVSLAVDVASRHPEWWVRSTQLGERS